MGLRRLILHVVPRASTRGRATEAAQILCRVEVKGELRPVTRPCLKLPVASRAQVAVEAARAEEERQGARGTQEDRKSTRPNSRHANILHAGFCVDKKKASRSLPPAH